jgi:hypothetical protein
LAPIQKYLLIISFFLVSLAFQKFAFSDLSVKYGKSTTWLIVNLAKSQYLT